MTQVACAEFVRGLERPTCLSLLKADGLAATGALEISPAVVFPIIDRLLGGGHDPSTPPARPLTDIERRLAARITAAWIEALARAWRDVAPTTFELVRLETNPHLASVATPSELVTVVHGELTIAEASGAWKFCLPSKCLENVRDRLLGTMPGTPTVAGSPGSATSFADASVPCGSLPATVELVAELATLASGRANWPACKSGTSSLRTRAWKARWWSRSTEPRNFTPARRFQRAPGVVHRRALGIDRFLVVGSSCRSAARRTPPRRARRRDPH